MPAGRPTKFKDEYCEMLEEHMAQGLSFEAFSGVVGTCLQTLYYWADTYEEFLESKKRGEGKARLFWEKVGTAGGLGKIKNFNSAVWIFSMKNKFGWRDKIDINPVEGIEGFDFVGKKETNN